MARPADGDFRGPVARRIACGDGWRIDDVVCRLGPDDPSEEERFDSVTIAVVLDGMFQCQTNSQTKWLLYPGACLLGNAGAAFSCDHDHGVGDHCVAFHFDRMFFEEIAATAAGSSCFLFPGPMLPSTSGLAWAVVESALRSNGTGSTAAEELAIGLAERVLRTLTGHINPSPMPLPRERRQLVRALHYVEEHSEAPLTLGDLAAIACMSKFHFLRCFRALTGLTPHQFLLDLRTRRAAIKLRTTSDPISAIAFDSGFGDLSTFNARFRAVFGVSPRHLRLGTERLRASDHRQRPI